LLGVGNNELVEKGEEGMTMLSRAGLLSIVCLTLLLFPHKTVHGQSASQTASQTTSQTTSQAPTKAEVNPWLRIANNGAWWNTLSQESKSDFVDGYVSAMANVHQMLIDILKQNTKEMTPGPKFDAQMSAIIQLGVIADRYQYEEVGRAKLLAGMDAFYKEPLNKLIPIEYAFAWERDTLNGRVAPRDLQKQLDGWRATMNK